MADWSVTIVDMRQQRVEKCPVCGSPYIGGFKAGTQQIEQVLHKNFPKARVLRMDYDTTRAKGSYEKILSSFAAHEADILCRNTDDCQRT